MSNTVIIGHTQTFGRKFDHSSPQLFYLKKTKTKNKYNLSVFFSTKIVRSRRSNLQPQEKDKILIIVELNYFVSTTYFFNF